MSWCLSFVSCLMLLGLSANARAEEAREQGTYIYCSKDSCRTAFRGELNLFFGRLPKAVRANCGDPNAYAMTFDDGPSEHWPEVLARLEKHGIRATFFVVGDHLASPENQALLREAYQKGHQISNHTRTHPDLLQESDDGVLNQLKTTEESIVSILGPAPDVLRDAKIVRPPFGYIDERVQSVFAANGYTAVRWNSDRSDWELGADQAALELGRLDQHLAFMRSQGGINSSVIDLNHDFSGATLANLDTMIERIQAAGYHFVTVSECLGQGSAPHADDGFLRSHVRH